MPYFSFQRIDRESLISANKATVEPTTLVSHSIELLEDYHCLLAYQLDLMLLPLGLKFLNQVCAALKSLSFPQSVCVCPPPRPLINSGVIMTLNDRLNNCSYFLVTFYGSFRRCHQ